MTTIRKTFALSDTQDDWIKRQIARGDFTSDSEYFRDLVRRDQEGRASLAGSREAIAAGMESGVSDRSLDDIWADGECQALSQGD